MSASFESVRFHRALREVRPAAAPPSQEENDRRRMGEEAAFERGRREAETALTGQLLQQRAELLELQNGVLRSLSQSLPELSKTHEGTLIQLALEAAKKVVADLPISIELVEGVVREALARAEATGEITVRLHPEDYDLLQRANSPVLLREMGEARFHLLQGPEVTRGGCIIQTRFGTIDATREKKLQLLQDSLTIE